jgi:hypothetical protein
LSDKKVGSIVGDLEVIEALAAKLDREVCISTRQQYFAIISYMFLLICSQVNSATCCRIMKLQIVMESWTGHVQEICIMMTCKMACFAGAWRA